MRAIAERISASKERITVDGNVYLKSVTIGRWNYVSEVVVDRGVDAFTFYARHADKQTASPSIPAGQILCSVRRTT